MLAENDPKSRLVNTVQRKTAREQTDKFIVYSIDRKSCEPCEEICLARAFHFQKFPMRCPGSGVVLDCIDS